MKFLNGQSGWNQARWLKVAVCLAVVCFAVASLAKAQSASRSRGQAPDHRLLTTEEGQAIVDTLLDPDQPARGAQDCSHLLHQIYLRAGFAYPYASSFELYAGNENFERVRNPQRGDLIAWPGHVGIVLKPKEHSFYSLVSTGLEAQNYQGPYWRSRGRPRFYRYKVADAGILSAGKASASSQAANPLKQRDAEAVIKERSGAEAAGSQGPLRTASEAGKGGYGRPAPPVAPAASTTSRIPQNIAIAPGNLQPTKDEVARAISELSNASGNVLRASDPSEVVLPMIIFERLRVERLEIRGNHGWAHLQLDCRAAIAAGGETDYKRRKEKVRWELQRTEMGWEAITPADRIYVPRDVAVRNLAAQLARLTEGDDALAHGKTVLETEARLANLLSGLLGKN
jgi:hypothetical protein